MKPILAIIGCAILAAASAASRGEDGGVAVMIANDSDDWIRLSCVCPGVVSECRITDADRTDEAVAMPSEMPPRSFLVAITEYPPNTDRAMPDGKTAIDIRDFGAAEGNTAAENAAAIQRAIDEVREQCDEDSRFPFYKYGLRLHPLDRSWFRPGPFEADVRK